MYVAQAGSANTQGRNDQWHIERKMQDKGAHGAGMSHFMEAVLFFGFFCSMNTSLSSDGSFALLG